MVQEEPPKRFETVSDDKPAAAKQKIRGKVHFITPRLCSALDNAKLSDGMAVHILIAAAEALGHNVEDLVINLSTLHRVRHENREKQFHNNVSDFQNVSFNKFVILDNFNLNHQLNEFHRPIPRQKWLSIGMGLCFLILLVDLK